MAIDRVNFFVQFESATAGHENQLTRALLVVLRYSPIALQVWLDLVKCERPLHSLSKPEFKTQSAMILHPDDIVTDGEQIQGISVWLAPDAPTNINTQIVSSDRQQILDGVITFGTDLVIVIESKVTWGEVTHQPHQINLNGCPVKFDPSPQPVSWQALLAAFGGLVEHDLVSGAERLVMTDFFEIVADHFPHLGAYSTLAQCGGHKFRLERRLDNIIKEAVGTDSGKGLGWRNLVGTEKIAMAWLGIGDSETEEVSLHMYPADTLGQARVFYGEPASVDAVLGLRSDGWDISPNFHWGFTAGGYAWTKTPLPVDDYCAYWIERIGTTGEVSRTDWNNYWFRLETDLIVEPAGREEFDKEFTQTNRSKANPRPGLRCVYAWPMERARVLDNRGKLIGEVRDRINQMLAALNGRLH